ncbi:glycosyltransferase [bacterium]|nr:MAG: glycosyltransferase [bacterium]
MGVCFITDPLVTTMGAVRPALLLAKEFRQSGYDVTFITPRFDIEIALMLKGMDVSLKSVGPKISVISAFPTLDAWARCLIRQRTAEMHSSDVVINTSSCIIGQADVYYAQGPMTKALDDVCSEMPMGYRYAYQLSGSSLRMLERNLVRRFKDFSRFFVANSAFCASMYREWGIQVEEVINPPLDCSFFKPSVSKPDTDYILTHFGVYGKENKISVIKAIADAGVKIKAFGNTSSTPKSLLSHTNIDFLGRVSNDELVDLYSNALYTLFAFNHEPFGYVPVESMACGTPVLTYNKQGPSETVTNGKTGWLAYSDKNLFKLAINIWKNGYRRNMRSNCRNKSLIFDSKKIYEKWIKVLQNLEK